MDQLAAFRDTIRLARFHDMPESPSSPLGFEHLRGMLEQAESGGFPEEKLGRWLGWAQCAVVAADIGVELDDMKYINRAHDRGITVHEPTGHSEFGIPNPAEVQKQVDEICRARML